MELKIWLWKNRLSMTDFCEIVGMSRSYLCEIANYRRKPSKRIAFMIEKETSGEVKSEFLMRQEYKDYLRKSA